MMAVATNALFASAAAIAVTTIVATIAPQRARIARLLRHRPEGNPETNCELGKGAI